MANKSFGTREINVIGIAGTPSIDSFDNLILDASTVFVEGEVIAQRFYGDGSGLTNVSGGGGGQESYWQAHGDGPSSGISTLASVGIGLQPEEITDIDPNARLTIQGGNIGIVGDQRTIRFYSSTVNVNVDTGIRFYEGIIDSVPRMAIDYNGSDAVPGTGQIDIKGTNNASGEYNIVFSVNRFGHVGIGSTLPKHALDIVGNTIITGVVTAQSFIGNGSALTNITPRWTLGSNGSSDYTFTGIGFTETTNDPVLYLARGQKYEFQNNAAEHPFEIRVSNSGAAYNNGVVNNSAGSGIVTFTVPFNAPNTLYYQCTVHSGMGNTIRVYPDLI